MSESGMQSWNSSGVAEILSGRAMAAEMQRRANAIAANARALAPVDTGRYRASIRVRVKYQQRAVAVVEATDPKSMLIEANYGVLTRSLRAAGG